MHIHKFFLAFMGRVLPAIIALASVSGYTRLVSPAQFGRYALMLAIALFISGTAFTWIRVAMLRTIAASETVNFEYLSLTLRAFLFTSLATTVVLIPALYLFVHDLTDIEIGFVSLATILNGFFEISSTYSQAMQKYLVFGIQNLTRAVLCTVVTFVAILKGYGSLSLIGGFCIGNLAGLMNVREYTYALRVNCRNRDILEMWHFGWPLSATFSLSQVLQVFGRFYLVQLFGAAKLGIFGVANDLARQTVSLLLGTISVTLLPGAIRSFETNGQQAARNQLCFNFKIMLALVIPVTVGLSVVAEPLSRLFFGKAFHEGSALIIAIVTWASLLSGLRTHYFDHAFEISRNTRPQAIISIAAMVAGIIVNLCVVPQMGSTGSALALLVSGCISLIASVVWGRIYLPFPIPWRFILKITASSIALAYGVVALPRVETPLELIVECVFGAVCYIAVLAILNYSSGIALIRRSRINRDPSSGNSGKSAK